MNKPPSGQVIEDYLHNRMRDILKRKVSTLSITTAEIEMMNNAEVLHLHNLYLDSLCDNMNCGSIRY